MWRDPLGYVIRLCIAALLLIALYDVVVSMLQALLRTISGAGGSTVAAHTATRTAPAGGGHLQALLIGTVVVLSVALAVHLGLLQWARRWYRSHVRRPRRASRGARYATVRELRRAGLLGPDGWPVGTIRGRLGRRYVVRLTPEREREGVLVCSATGSGKGICGFVPAILSETLRSGKLRSLIIVDPADELGTLTMPALSATHRVLVWDPSDAAAWTVTFDPLLTLPSPEDDRYVEEVLQLASELYWTNRSWQGTGNQPPSREPYFDNQGRALMCGVFFTYLARYPNGSFVHMADWIRSLDFHAFIEEVETSGSAEATDYLGQARSLALNERGVGSIWPDVLERFAWCKGRGVRKAMATTRPVDWQAFVREPTALYIRVAVEDADRLRPLLSLFLARAYRELSRLASQRRTRCLEREVRVLCDELGNLAQIYGLPKALATLRKRGIGHYLGLQTTAQLPPLYGDDGTKDILGNLVTKLYLGGVSQEDARAMADRCGQVTDYVPTNTYTATGLFHPGQVNYGYAPDRHPLISAAELIHLGREAIMSTRGLPPVRLTLRRYMDDPEMRQLVPEEEDAPEPDAFDAEDEPAAEAWA